MVAAGGAVEIHGVPCPEDAYRAGQIFRVTETRPQQAHRARLLPSIVLADLLDQLVLAIVVRPRKAGQSDQQCQQDA